MKSRWTDFELLKKDEAKEYKRWCKAIDKIKQLQKTGMIVTGTRNKYHQYGGLLSSKQLEYIFTSPQFDTIRLEFVQISGKIDIFSDWGIKYNIDKFIEFSDCTFLDTCKIHATFKGEFKIDRCKFNSHTLWLSTFERTAYFVGNTFEDEVEFRVTADSIYFSGSEFKNDAEFGGMAKYVDFSPVDLDTFEGFVALGLQYGPAYFEKDVTFYFGIYRTISLEQVTIENGLYISISIDKLKCRETRVMGDELIFFESGICGIKDTIDFRNMIIMGLLNIKQLEINRECKILLSGISFDRMLCSWTQLSDRLDFEQLENLNEAKAVYHLLYENFMRYGARHDAHRCYYELKELERKYERLTLNPFSWLNKIWLYCQWAMCGYLVKPLHSLFFAIFAIIIFNFLLFVSDGYIISKSKFRYLALRHLSHLSKKQLTRELEKKDLRITGTKTDLIEQYLRISDSADLLSDIKPNILKKSSLHYWKICLLYSGSTFIRFGIATNEFYVFGATKKWILLVEASLGWLTLALFIITLVNVILL